MNSNIKLTTKQAEEKMKIYREVFDVVMNYKIHRYSQNAMWSRAGT